MSGQVRNCHVRGDFEHLDSTWILDLTQHFSKGQDDLGPSDKIHIPLPAHYCTHVPKKQLGLKYRNTVHRIFLHIIYVKNCTMVNYSEKLKKIKFDSVVY